VKLLVFSDIHLDAVTAGKPRRQEVVSFLRQVRDIAIAQKVHVVVFSGDAHDSGWLLDPLYTSELIDAFFCFHQELVVIPGNHDVLDTSELFDGEPVSTLTPLRAAFRFLHAHRHPVHVMERPSVRRIGFPAKNHDWALLALPYVSRAHSKQNEEWLDEAFAAAKKQVDAGAGLIVVGHLVVPGAAMGSESQEMAKGQDQLFPFERVAELKPRLVINGHYHARQVVKGSGVEIVIPGSPLRFTFGEADEVAKGVTIVELEK
jgi:DNA repair exonuclease SbcCD nuclease subunit